MQLIWRECIGFDDEPPYWELVRKGDDTFFAHQYATVWRKHRRLWELRVPDIHPGRSFHVDVTHHKSFTSAKSVGIVTVLFNKASKPTGTYSHGHESHHPGR